MSRRTPYLVFLIALGSLPWTLGAGRPGEAGPSPATGTQATTVQARRAGDGLVADRVEHDFGGVRIDGGKVTARFKLKNDASEVLRVTDLYTSCMCTTVSLEFSDSRVVGPFGMPGHDLATALNRPIAAGEEFVASVTFDPAAHGPAGVGPVVREVLFQTAEHGRLVLTLTANVLPPKG
jgi:Protein of unknown function (DUF1573)